MIPSRQTARTLLPRATWPITLAALLGLAPVARSAAPAPTPAAPSPIRAGALSDEFVLLGELKGIIILPRAELVKPGPFRASPGLDASQVPLLPPDSAAMLAPAFIGQPVSYASLERITAAIRLTLQQLGYPFVSAYLPPQDISAGWVQIVAQLSVAAPTQVEGAKYFSADHYRSALRQQPGQPINSADLKADLDWLNRNPFHQVAIVAEPGVHTGTTALKLRVNERFPLRVTAGYSNTGSRVSAEDRLSAGFNWGNAFGRGDQFGYNFSASPDVSTSRTHSANYALDLPWRHTLRLSGTYSELTGRVAAPLALSGRSWQTSLRYELPLRTPAPNLTQTVSAGVDFKASNNNLEFARIPLTDNLTHIAQFTVAYDLTRSDARGRTELGAAVFASPGGLASRNRTTPFNLSRAGARPDYAYATLTVARTQRLPQGFSWSPRAQLQAASGNLLGSEQMNGGGSNSVRGYEEGEAYGDHGALLSHELTLPAFAVAHRLGAESLSDSLQLFAFQDYAYLRSARPLAGEAPVTLHSVGSGLRYQAGARLSINFTYGWQLRDSGLSRTGKNSRAHLSAQTSF